MDKVTLEINFNKIEFIEKLHSITIPISIEKINETNKQFILEDNIFAETQMPENYIFAGEVNETEIKIFIPDPTYDKAFKTDYLMTIANDEIRTLLQKQIYIRQAMITYSSNNYKYPIYDSDKLFYYEIGIEELSKSIRLNIVKHKFQHGRDCTMRALDLFNQRSDAFCLISGDKTFFFILCILTLVYFIEKLLVKTHPICDLIFIPLFIIGLVLTPIFRINKSLNYTNQYRKISDEIFVLLLKQLFNY